MTQKSDNRPVGSGDETNNLRRAITASKRGLATYFGSWWLPTATALVALAINAMLPYFVLSYRIPYIVGDIMNVAILSIAVAGTWQLTRKSWVKGFGSLGLFVAMVGLWLLTYVYLGFFGPSEDGFGRDIVIPPDMAFEDPLDQETEDIAVPDRPDIVLVDGIQGGIYWVHAHVNPGEEGNAYLKVFEATTNRRLSGYRIRERTEKTIKWSEKPNELFHYRTEVTVYEGDWDYYYPARFELWFVPTSGAPERKLVEKVFRIEGWMR